MIPDLIAIIRSYLHNWENTVIDGDKYYIREVAAAGWDSVIHTQSRDNLSTAVENAITNKHLSTMQILYKLWYNEPLLDWLRLAVATGNVDVFDMVHQWILGNSLAVAIKKGYTSMVTSLLKTIPPTTENLEFAAYYGYVDIYRLLRPLVVDIDMDELISSAFHGGLLNVVRELPRINYIKLDNIARYSVGNIRSVNYILQCKMDPNLILADAEDYSTVALAIAFGAQPKAMINPILDRILSYL